MKEFVTGGRVPRVDDVRGTRASGHVPVVLDSLLTVRAFVANLVFYRGDVALHGRIVDEHPDLNATEVVQGLVEVEVAVPRLIPALR